MEETPQPVAIPAVAAPALAAVSIVSALSAGILSSRWPLPSAALAILFLASSFALLVVLPVVAYSLATNRAGRNWKQVTGFVLGLAYPVVLIAALLSTGI
jgi:hypothetical protein